MFGRKKIVDKCVNCGGNFRRAGTGHSVNVAPSGKKIKDFYKGNEIAYNFREKKHIDIELKYSTGEIKHNGESAYSWHTWSGEHYYSTSNSMYFCSGKCEKEFGSDCARANVRRLGGTLVRFNKGDRRAS